MDYYSTVSLEDNRREPRRKYMNLKQRVEVVKTLNEACLFQLDFYYSKMYTKNYDFNDKSVATAIGYKVSKVRDNRLKLQKAGYFSQIKTTNANDTNLLTVLGHASWKK